jgi:hypothetical protein
MFLGSALGLVLTVARSIGAESVKNSSAARLWQLWGISLAAVQVRLYGRHQLLAAERLRQIAVCTRSQCRCSGIVVLASRQDNDGCVVTAGS